MVKILTKRMLPRDLKQAAIRAMTGDKKQINRIAENPLVIQVG